ncbi:MAG: N-acetylglucosamine-6-phosphate deacetylase [Hyphomicrobiales bacterium]|nr:N-acetylglucosamine-6-phosphate deacetylase [Hyphomicrobiales bacterium]
MKLLHGARLFDGERFVDDRAVVVEGAAIGAVIEWRDRPLAAETIDLAGGVLAPGFVDWQINGGGGVLFNAEPTVEAIAKIGAAHRREGVTGFLPTVITDAPDVLASALTAARKAHARVPGALGVHVEGPFIDLNRKGVHPPEWIRPMRQKDAEALIAARAGAMVVTLAPASVSLELVGRLAGAGIVVSLGHSDATAEEAEKVFHAGARAVTHLFNAMSQLVSRAPGVVGAALADERVICGVIADGEHARPAAYRTAIAAKGARGIALVSDAMPPSAGGPASFELQGRRIKRAGMKLVDERGTLAGAAITMRDAVRYLVRDLGRPLAEALTMATLTPARLLGLDHRIGRLKPGFAADLVHLTDELDVAGVWAGGRNADEIGAPQ